MTCDEQNKGAIEAVAKALYDMELWREVLPMEYDDWIVGDYEGIATTAIKAYLIWDAQQAVEELQRQLAEVVDG